MVVRRVAAARPGLGVDANGDAVFSVHATAMRARIFSQACGLTPTKQAKKSIELVIIYNHNSLTSQTCP
jgi:hypothetical protein